MGLTMENKIQVATRQNEHGTWWCNTTHEGYDIFEEGETIDQAQSRIIKRLNSRWYIGKITFEEPQLYPQKEPTIKPDITPLRNRIDFL